MSKTQRRISTLGATHLLLGDPIISLVIPLLLIRCVDTMFASDCCSKQNHRSPCFTTAPHDGKRPLISMKGIAPLSIAREPTECPTTGCSKAARSHNETCQCRQSTIVPQQLCKSHSQSAFLLKRLRSKKPKNRVQVGCQ